MLPIALTGFDIQSVEEDEGRLAVQAYSTARKGICPSCGKESHALHGWHVRYPQDLPCVGRQLRFRLQVRRFRCANAGCKRQTFVERFGDWLAVYARRTERLTSLLRQIAREVGGEMGRRIMGWLPVETSGDTLLRVLKQWYQPPVVSPKAVGVDDWAIKRGQRYGTILVDLEQHQVIDLLPDREADTLAQWLQQHPTIEILTRDRSTEYARGMTKGAPQAQQVADRWHLLLNLRQMVERSIQHGYAELQQIPIAPEHTAAFQRNRSPFHREKTHYLITEQHRQERWERYNQVQLLKDQGLNMSQIVRETGLARSTVRNYYHATIFPERKKAPPRPSKLDPYLPCLKDRLNEGIDNASLLFREIQKQGYSGSAYLVYRWVNGQRTTVSHHTIARHRNTALKTPHNTPELPSVRQLAWLMVKAPECLEPEDNHRLAHIQQHLATSQLYLLVQRFRQLVKERQAEQLDRWLDDCQNTELTQLKTFAKGIQQDYDAIRAALSQPWSNGQTEGQVNRLKFIKRQMYGRASFELLRARVLS